MITAQHLFGHPPENHEKYQSLTADLCAKNLAHDLLNMAQE
jgi:hypothetical protein